MQLHTLYPHAFNQWRALVDKDHPSVAALLGTCQSTDLATIVACFRTTFRWVGVQGWAPYEDAMQTGKGNCLTLSALLCATLDAANFPSSYVLMAGGGSLDRALIAVDSAVGVLTVHAWTVIPRPDQTPAIVDPVTMEVEDVPDAGRLYDRLKLAALEDTLYSFVFNHHEVHMFTNIGECFRLFESAAVAASYQE